MKRIAATFLGMAIILPALARTEVCNNCVVYQEPGKHARHRAHHRHMDRPPGHRKHWKNHSPGHRKHWKKRDRKYVVVQPRYEPVLGRVVAVKPVYTVHTQPAGYDSCIQRRDSGGYYTWAPTVLGAVIGGTVGHKLGDSYGDADTAAIAGGVLGAAIGRDVTVRNRESRRISVRGPCGPGSYDRQQQESVAYVVSYRYNGRVYRTHMDYHPGEWLELDDNYRPI